MAIVIHFMNTRLRNNAGMEIPECKAYAKLLDCGSSRWATTTDRKKVTCKNCLKKLKEG